jgi:CcmD family protein
MTNIFKKIAALTLLMLSVLMVFGQQAGNANDTVQMADGMRSNGKIYVVVAVLVTVLAGLFFYIIRLDRRISQLEKK